MAAIKKMEGKELEILFPERKIEIGGGVEVTVRPIPLPHLEKVLDAFANVIQLATAGISPIMIVVKAASDLAKLLPYCIDRDISEIPAGAAPRLMEAVIELNFTEDVLGNWQALVEKMGAVAPKIDQNQGTSSPQ